MPGKKQVKNNRKVCAKKTRRKRFPKAQEPWDWGDACAAAAVASRELADLSRTYAVLHRVDGILFALKNGVVPASTPPSKPVNRRTARFFKTIHLASHLK